MKKQPDEIVKILSFNPETSYFGLAKCADIDMFYRDVKRSRGWNIPVLSRTIKVGYIDSRVIGDALANEMSYNPLRWGNQNPFMIKNIYEFCRGWYEEESLNAIKATLYDFLKLNANLNGQWSDNPVGQSGFIDIERRVSDGKFNSGYCKMFVLHKCMKIIAKQNLADFKAKDEPYRVEIIKTLADKFPDKVKVSDFILPDVEPVMLPDVEPETQLDLFGNYKMITKQKYMEKLEQAKQSIGRNNWAALEKQR